MNLQPVEKQDLLNRDGDLDVVGEPWLTIQGEGPFVGEPAIFVRLAGCNIQCPFCDTNYTSDRNKLTVGDLLIKVGAVHPAKYKPLVVITGGEPFRQNISPFVRELLYANYPVQIETNGTLAVDDFPYASVTIVCSPKTPRVDGRLKEWTRHLKYVVDARHIDPEDGLPTSVLGNGLRPCRPWTKDQAVWIQPAEDEHLPQTASNTAMAIMICQKYGYRLSVQIHKWLGLK